jgi:hypothetical protein
MKADVTFNLSFYCVQKKIANIPKITLGNQTANSGEK